MIEYEFNMSYKNHFYLIINNLSNDSQLLFISSKNSNTDLTYIDFLKLNELKNLINEKLRLNYIKNELIKLEENNNILDIINGIIEQERRMNYESYIFQI